MSHWFRKTKLTARIGVLMLLAAMPVEAASQENSQETGPDNSQGFMNWGPAPTWTSAEGGFSLKIRGRLMLDHWRADGSGETFGIPGDVDLPKGWNFRRGRLGIEGKMLKNWQYRFVAGFNGHEIIAKDAYIRFNGIDGLKITAGNQKEPFSLEELGSSRFATFIERAVPNLFAPSRSVGLAIAGGGEKFSVSGGVFGPTFERTISKLVSDRTSVTGRVTWTPLNSENAMIHLGVAASYTDLHGDGRSFRLRGRPEIQQSGPRLIDTGFHLADDTLRYGLEAAVVFGQFSLQTEYIADRVDYEDQDLGNPTFDGYYVQASWFITGESRAYGGGAFGRVTPNSVFGKNGIGAWEVAVRYSQADLRSSAKEAVRILGGKSQDFTAGVNWYLNGYVRVMVNYVHFKVRDSLERPFGFERIKGDGVGARVQIDW